MIHFESPLAFFLLLFIPFIIFWHFKRLNRGSIRFSSTNNAARSGKSFRQNWAFIPLFLRISAWICIILALARPQKGTERIRETTKGIAIEMVVDRSGSMATEMEYHGSTMNRLEVVKKVFEEFVLGNRKGLKGRPDDLIGMIEFARYANTVCPLTLAHGALSHFIKGVKLVQHKAEDGTAIGDGLALAAARLKTAEETFRKQKKADKQVYQIKSKIIILLSDGENNCGKRDPLQAAELAKKWGIKIYTIVIGGGGGMRSVQTPFGVYKVSMGGHVDTSTLKQIAKTTGGFFKMAEDAKSLQEIYKKIDKMERTRIEAVRFVDYKERFIWFAVLALLFLALEIILNTTMFRKIP